LQKYPQSAHSATAASNLCELSFKGAAEQNTVEALESFMRAFPESMRTQEASEKLAALTWKNVSASNTVSAYESFLSRFARSSFAPQAINALAKVEYQAATNANTIQDYEAFLKAFPNSELSPDVASRLKTQTEERDWNQTLLKHTAQAYTDFWKAHPTATRFNVYRTLNPAADGFNLQLHATQLWFTDGGRNVGGEVSNVEAIGTGPTTEGAKLMLAASSAVKDGQIQTEHYGVIKVRPPEQLGSPTLKISFTDESIVRVREALEREISSKMEAYRTKAVPSSMMRKGALYQGKLAFFSATSIGIRILGGIDKGHFVEGELYIFSVTAGTRLLSTKQELYDADFVEVSTSHQDGSQAELIEAKVLARALFKR
jgi:hypothetical protein